MMARRTLLLAPAMASAAATDVLDYGRSFLSGKASWNRVRFLVESRTTIIDDKTGRREVYYQCASCKSENTFAAKDLFMAGNYDFLPVFGPEWTLIFRRKAAANPSYREIKRSAEAWGGQTMGLRPAKGARPLPTVEKVRQATHAGWPLVAVTEVHFAETGLRAVMEFPVKTMNIEDGKNLYQVDTGPVAYPDLTRSYERWADSISLAFVAFNTEGFADFILEAETPIAGGTGRVHHYSRIVTHAAKNRLIACQD